MNDLLKERCEKLADNRDAIHGAFNWDSSMMSIAAGMVFVGADKSVDVTKMKECEDILKEETGMFSDFRGEVKLAVISKMVLEDDPKAYLDTLTQLYGKLREGRFFGSEYMVMAAINIVDANKQDQAEEIAAKAKDIMNGMKSKHPYLSSDRDMSYVSLLAMTEKTADQIVADVEACYKIMKEHFPHHKTAAQSLGQILALMDGTPEEKCSKVMELFDSIKSRGLKYGKEHELAALGALVNSKTDVEQLAGDIVEASDYLKTRKGFGNWDIGKEERLMFAALLAAGVHTGDNALSEVLGNSLSVVIAEEVAMIMIIILSSTVTYA